MNYRHALFLNPPNAVMIVLLAVLKRIIHRIVTKLTQTILLSAIFKEVSVMGRFGMSREATFASLKEHVKTDNLLKHCLATEAIMRSLAIRLGEDPDDWGLVGLIHDLDYDMTKEQPETHTVVAADILRKQGIPDDYIVAIMSHNEAVPGTCRSSPLEHLLAAAENITGLIVAAALVLPDKKLASVKTKSLRKRMKEKAFARTVDRSAIMECEQVGIPIDEFLQISLEAMQKISDDLGL